MTDTTATFWDVDGESLQTYAWNIQTLGGDRAAPPSLRGSNTLVPYRPGTKYVPRVVADRIITLGMWVQGSQEDGTPPTDEALRRQWERNWRKLIKLLWRPRVEFTLTKRFWLLTEDLEDGGVDTSGLPSQGDWSLYTASAKASFAGGLSPTMQGQAHGIFTVDLLLSDPFFYGDIIEVPFSTQTGGANPGPNHDVVILGDERTTWVEVDFVGPLTSPRLDNISGSVWLRYGTEIPAGESATVKAQDFSAMHFTTGDDYRSSGHVIHGGDKFWLFLGPGDTTLELSAQAGTGTASLRYRPVWL